MPISVTIWTYDKARARVRAGLRVLAILGYPVSIGVLWGVEELNDNTSPLNVPLIVTALTLAAGATGVAVGWCWPGGNWLVRGALGVLVLLNLSLTGFVSIIAILFLTGVH